MKKQNRKPKQLHLIKPGLKFFGGQLLHGKRKAQRPLSTKDSIHLVMRSSWAMGRYSMLRKQNKDEIHKLITSISKKYGVRIYQRAVASNHIHLIVRITTRKLYYAFIRVLSSKIALHVMKAPSFEEFKVNYNAQAGDALTSASKRGRGDAPIRAPGAARTNPGDASTQAPAPSHHHSASTQTQNTKEPQGKGQKFWQFRPFSRVLSWGRDYKTCFQYLQQNTLEAFGFIIYRKRNHTYARWLSAQINPVSKSESG